MNRLRPGGAVFPWVPTTSLMGSTIPSNNRFYITTFGGGADRQCIGCRDSQSPEIAAAPRSTAQDVANRATTYCSDVGKPVADGSWWYVADSSRWACGTKLRISDPATGRSCVAVVADGGPGSWVEHNANGAIIDASPLVLRHLFGRDSYGWQDHKEVEAVEVDRSTPVGPAGNIGVGPSSSESGATLALAAALIALGVGSFVWLEHRKSFAGVPRHNPTGFLVRTIAYTPTYADAHKRHVASVWAHDLESAYAFAEDFAQRNHAKVEVDRGSTETLAVFGKDR